ncbi:MAG: DUF4445 domain-containing protein, partial [Chitinivibrionales bacterium]|nr:DUF4445 domain-containing protein [Chitinivibrionales bacterium]MBD3357991.1 DUF4445 domain-containing protein [Chitinivibrionales bacterium]
SILPASAAESHKGSRRYENGFHTLPNNSDCPEAIASVKSPCGVAIDLGTTSISFIVYSFKDGRRLTGRFGMNPQLELGSDIFTRLSNANESPEKAGKAGNLLVNAIGSALYDIAKYDGIDPERIVSITIVGNTGIISLLTQDKYRMLLDPESWMKPIRSVAHNVSSWKQAWGIHKHADIHIVPSIAGFVGADILAGVYSLGIIECPRNSLLIDFGTNSEIALWNGENLFVTSASGGPAFEGAGIGCGMPAELGAICKAVLTPKNEIVCSTVGDADAKGICGSGLIDIIAIMRNNGTLSESGNFIHEGMVSYDLQHGAKRLRITKRDIDVIQRAKAAVGAGIRILLDAARMQVNRLEKVYIAGAFGSFLNIENGKAIGLIPPLENGKFELCGNTALAGCEEIMISGGAESALNRILEKSKILNMSGCEDFEDYFLDNLYLKQM